MDEQIGGLRPNYLPALAFVGVLIVFQNLAIHSDSSPDPFLRPALSVTQAFRLPPEMQPAEFTMETLEEATQVVTEYQEGDLAMSDWGSEQWEQPPEEDDPELEADEEDGELYEHSDPDPIAAAILGHDHDHDPAPAPVQVREPAPQPVRARAPAPEPTRNLLEYTVRRGDTLYGISKRFRVPVAQLVLCNRHLGDIHQLRPGMTLSLKASRSLNHQVDAGESLWSIAKLYGITVGELITANSLEQQRIYVNQKLEIPTARFTAEQFETALRRQKNRGKTFLIPVNGRKTDHFGMRNHPILAKRILHGGLDIAAPEGTPIKASQKGVVTFSGKLGGYGYLIEIRHANGFKTRYGHCSKLLKKKGDRVSRGDPVGLIGSTGLATAAHVHFEIRKNGVPHDPMKYL